jgi:hypothetical protein
MGTRADFYIGRGTEAEWLGSIAWDGYPEGITPNGTNAWPDGQHLFDAQTEIEFRERLAQFFAGRDDVTLPADGWPWPWTNSQTTDYAYAFDNGEVYASCFGCEWYDPQREYSEEEFEAFGRKQAVFPEFSKDTMARPGSTRSGIIVI